MSVRAVWLVMLLLIGETSAQSLPPVPYPRDYKTNLVRYAVVDRSDGMSRDLYASRDAINALKRDPGLTEFPVGVLFAIDVYSAKLVGRDPKSRDPRFEVTAQGRLARSKDERTLHLMQKIRPGLKPDEVRRLRESFDQSKEYRLVLKVDSMNVSGDEAVVKGRREDNLVSKGGESFRNESSFTFRLKRTGDSWIIDGVK